MAPGTRFCHIQNSKYLDQNIGSINHKLSLLVNDDIAECYASQEKENVSTMGL